MEPKELKNFSEKDELEGKVENTDLTKEEPAVPQANKTAKETSDVSNESATFQKESAVSDETNQNESESPQQSIRTDNLKNPEQPSIEKTVIPNLSKVELINYLKKIISTVDNPELIREDVENIKKSFYRIHKAEIQDQKNVFIDAGNPEEDFQPEKDLYEAELKNLLHKYKEIKAEHNQTLEREKEYNYQEKLKVIEGIKDLVNRKESLNETFHEFRNLQQRWREIGMIPQAKIKDLWETYHLYVEQFYNYVKINKELRDLDLKKNLDLKLTLCSGEKRRIMGTLQSCNRNHQ